MCHGIKRFTETREKRQVAEKSVEGVGVREGVRPDQLIFVEGIPSEFHAKQLARALSSRCL